MPMPGHTILGMDGRSSTRRRHGTSATNVCYFNLPFLSHHSPVVPLHQAATWITRTFELSRPCRKCGCGDGFGKPFCQSSFGAHGGGAVSPRARTNTFPKSRLIPQQAVSSPVSPLPRCPICSFPFEFRPRVFVTPRLPPARSILRYDSPPGSSGYVAYWRENAGSWEKNAYIRH